MRDTRAYIINVRACARIRRGGYRLQGGKSLKIFGRIKKKQYLCRRIARSSAVGSAPRSGRGGRAFESPLLDNKRVASAILLLLKNESEENALKRGPRKLVICGEEEEGRSPNAAKMQSCDKDIPTTSRLFSTIKGLR